MFCLAWRPAITVLVCVLGLHMCILLGTFILFYAIISVKFKQAWYLGEACQHTYPYSSNPCVLLILPSTCCRIRSRLRSYSSPIHRK